MDTINYEGTVYTKASVLAKRFRYTADYIGQLCRSGKIDARLVGRSWYVNEAALINHKEARYKPVRENEIANNINAFNAHDEQQVKIEVRPRLAKITAKMVTATAVSTKHFAERLAAVPVRYELDESELLPQPVIKRRIEPAVEKIDVVPADSKKLRITITDKPTTKLDFTPLPEVELSGVIEVTEISSESEDFSPEPVSFKSIKPTMPAQVVRKKGNLPFSPVVDKSTKTRHSELPKSISFTPAAVKVEDEESLGSWKAVSFTVVVLGLVLFVVLTMTSNVIVVEGKEPQSRVDFNLANVALLWQLFE